MALKHGEVTDGGLGITGCLIHEKRETTEDISIESMDASGAFAAGQGKSIRKKVTVAVKGECLTTAALPTAGVGAGTGADGVHIDTVETGETNEGAGDFSVTGHYHEAGEGDWA